MSAHDDDPDVTIWAGRLRAWPPADPHDVRAAAAEPETAADTGEPTEPLPPPGPRRRGGSVPSDDAEAAEEPDAGSTVVAHRESRRRAAREPDEHTALRTRVERDAPAVADAASGARREAHVPPPLAHEEYAPRAAEPVVAPRREPPRRTSPPAQPPRAAARSRTHARRILGVVLVAAGVLALLAGAVAVLVLAVG